MNQNKLNIWDDSMCTVEDEYNAVATKKIPNPTIVFKNSLINNKGNIKTARKISNLETVFK